MSSKFIAAAIAAAVLSGCVATDRPTTKVALVSVEQRKKDVASLRDRGVISYEEAARRQFEIQRNAYALTPGEISFWRASIEYAAQVDRHRITKTEYRRLTAAAYQAYVVENRPGKPVIFGSGG